MSQKKQEMQQGRRTATDRMREQRERDRAKGRRGRNLTAAGVVVALLAVAAGVGAMIKQQSGGGGGSTADARPITVGKGGAPAKLTVYEDFRCPACGQFEQRFRSTVHGLEKEGKLKAEYHLVTIIDDNLGGNGSRKAANAAACARDAGRFRQFHDALYRNQPREQDDTFASTKHLIELAKKVDGLDGSRFRECVSGGAHDGWVKKTNAAFKKSGFKATPTVLLDGEDVYGNQSEPLTPQGLKKKIEEKS